MPFDRSGVNRPDLAYAEKDGKEGGSGDKNGTAFGVSEKSGGQFDGRGQELGGHPGQAGQDTVRLGIARYLAWVLLILILAFSVFLAVIVGNRARDTLLTKQRNFAGILAEHLNQQIFVRFSIPVVAAYGRQNLRQNAQYVMLDQTVASLTHGLQVQALRIFDVDGEIKYSSRDRGEVGYKTPVTEYMVRTVVENQAPAFEVDENVSFWELYLSFFRMPPGAFYLRTVAPMRPVYSLRVENTAS